ncbi:MAG: DUF3857 domain-containing protein, partial [Chitinophagia bacterium]|nr:DUF3857 domain-containing protein [Chitinophagia bacterium]
FTKTMRSRRTGEGTLGGYFINFQLEQNKRISHARLIYPSGTVRTLTPTEIKYDKTHDYAYLRLDLTHDSTYRLPAFTELELLTESVAPYKHNGYTIVQTAYPILRYSLHFSYPKELSLSVKGYHGFAANKGEILNGNRKEITVEQKNIPPLYFTDYSLKQQYRMRYEYITNAIVNKQGQVQKTYTWNDFTATIYNKYYTFTQADKIALDKWLTLIGIRGGEKEEDKIKKIELLMKTKPYRTSLAPYDYSLPSPDKDLRIASLMAQDTLSEAGYLRLFCGTLRAAGIRHLLGFASSRLHLPIDTTFATWAHFNHPLFYFPAYKTFMIAQERGNQNFSIGMGGSADRYPLLPADLLPGTGVFLPTDPEIEYRIGSLKGEADAIVMPLMPYSSSINQRKGTYIVVMNDDNTVKIVSHFAVTGYQANELKTLLLESRTDTAIHARVKKIIKQATDPSAKSLLFTDNFYINGVKNVTMGTNFPGNPLLFTVTEDHKKLSKSEDSKFYYLSLAPFVYNLIDRYEDYERVVLPYDFEYKFMDSVTVNIYLRKGMKVEGLDNLNKYVEHINYKDAEVPHAYFQSNYTFDKDLNMLTINITQRISKLHYGVEELPYIAKLHAANDALSVSRITFIPAKKHHRKAPKPKK